MTFWARRSTARPSPATLSRRALLKAGLLGAASLAGGRTALSAGLYRERPPLPGLGPSFRTTVAYPNTYRPGTIVVNPKAHFLYFTLSTSKADRYKISVGRDGFGWSGTVTVGAKHEWPAWRPPASMRQRSPDLPQIVPPGPYNPLGARALYLFRNGKDTLYRIHGTNHPDGVGVDGTSGCFRLTNTDIIELYKRVPVGTTVIVE